jgi:peptidyl-dipeptidase Dcp
VIDDEADLAGLPAVVKETAAEEAAKRGLQGKWVFTLHHPSLIPFLQYAEKRDLREKMFKAYSMRGDNNNELDNKKIVSRIASLRVERANLLGYPTHAHFQLERNMAKNPANVYELLDRLWKPALNSAPRRSEKNAGVIKAEGHSFALQPWDWCFTPKGQASRVQPRRRAVAAYFKLENVIQGVFDVAGRLYGIQFVERTDLRVYHPKSRLLSAEADGSNRYFVHRLFPARQQARRRLDERFARAIQYRRRPRTRSSPTAAFSQAHGGKALLVEPGRSETLFHEFGHALHGLLSNCTILRSPALRWRSICRIAVPDYGKLGAAPRGAQTLCPPL